MCAIGICPFCLKSGMLNCDIDMIRNSRKLQDLFLNYRFHNSNTAEATADYILKVFIGANMKKVERAIQEAAEKSAGYLGF